jgi:hypothetical protein
MLLMPSLERTCSATSNDVLAERYLEIGVHARPCTLAVFIDQILDAGEGCARAVGQYNYQTLAKTLLG